MKTALALLFAVCAALLAAGSPAEARKVALVIGNQEYANLPALQKSAADATGFAETFRAKGFDSVIVRHDLTRGGMDEAIAGFIDGIEAGDTAVFVYSGHGWSDGTTNYIVGTDAPATAGPALLARLAIPIANGVNGIVDAMTARGAALKVAIVDACRDNPFKAQVAGKGIGLERGFNRMRDEPPDGTFLVFSAGAGQVALDRLSDSDADPNGVFTRTFLPLLNADMSLLDATKSAQEKVFELAKAVGHDQLPAYYDEVRGKACLSANCGLATPPPILAPAIVNREGEFWAYIKDAKNPDYFSEYLRLFPDGTFSAVARGKLAALEAGRKKRAETTDLPTPLPPPKIVRLRLPVQVWDTPTAAAKEVRIVPAGREIVVLGAIGNGDWYRIVDRMEYADDGRAFVPRTVLDAAAPMAERVASAEPTLADDLLQKAVGLYDGERQAAASALASIRYGAVAQKGRADFTYVWSRDSAAAASRDVEANCGAGCKVIATLGYKQCFSLYWAGRNGWGWAVRNGIADTNAAALKSCANSNRGCYKRRSFCSDGSDVFGN